MKFKRETSAGGIVFKIDNEGVKWLIVQLSAYKGWGFPKGHVGDIVKNESREEAALREVKEEGGVETKIIHEEPIKIEYMYKREDYLIKKHVYYFLMEYKSGDTKNHDWEISDIKFTTTDEVRKTLSFKSDKEAFEKALILYQHEGVAS